MQKLMWWTQAKFVLAVVVVIFHQNRILLLEHSYRPRYPWGLPTGWVHYGETLEDAVRREVREEAGVDLGFVHWLYAEFPSRRHLEVGYWAEADTAADGVMSADGEIVSSRWIPYDGELPEKLLPTQRAIIESAVKARAQQLPSAP